MQAKFGGGRLETYSYEQRACRLSYFSCEVEPSAQLPLSYKDVGIDLGVSHLATLSNGEMIEHPRYLRKGQATLKRRQQAVSRKKKGSHRRKKAGKLVGKAHRKIANQRRDFLHKQLSK